MARLENSLCHAEYEQQCRSYFTYVNKGLEKTIFEVKFLLIEKMAENKNVLITLLYSGNSTWILDTVYNCFSIKKEFWKI